MEMKAQMLRTGRFCYTVPRFSHEAMETVCSMGQGQVEVEMRNAARLEFKYPQIVSVGVVLTKQSKEAIQVTLDSLTVRGAVVVGHAKLTNQGRAGVTGNEPEPRSGLVGKIVYLTADRGRTFFFNVGFADDTQSTRVYFDTYQLASFRRIQAERLRYGTRNKPPRSAASTPTRRARRGSRCGLC